jgi:Ser/Thr protein kinase RdoA (MazF antagonist)
MDERPLAGGRVTPGVVRVGDTVRRPAARPFVRRLLEQLEERGFDAAPRFLGSDEQGRDVLTFLPGDVPPELAPDHPDDVLVAAATLIRRFHDATAGSDLAAGAEVVCHNDLSPCNTVFRAGVPAALIDFDDAAPGARLDDLGYALFLWLNLGTDGPPPAEQARRIAVFCGAYGIEPDRRVVEAVTRAVSRSLERLRAAGRRSDAEWWAAQLAWLRAHPL